MNFHPTILSHAAFIDQPHSMQQLWQVIALIEEKAAEAVERQRVRLPRTDAFKVLADPDQVRPVRGCPLAHH